MAVNPLFLKAAGAGAPRLGTGKGKGKGKKKGGKSHAYRAGNRSLCLFGPKSVVRMSAAWLVTRKWFDYIMIAFIVWSSVNLGLDGPDWDTCREIPEGEPGSCHIIINYLYISDVIIGLVFTLEALLKIVARGFAFTPRAYVRSKWNLLDLFVVLISWVSLAVGTSGDQQVRGLRSLRALRAFRPLRVISRFPGMRLVVNAVIAALPKVAEVTSLMVLFMWVMAVIGVQNFKGTTASCNDPSVPIANCSGTFNTTGDMCAYQPTEALEAACRLSPWGMPFPRQAAAQAPNFNNIGSALLVQFELSTGENWPGLMIAAVDGVGPGEAPRRDYNAAAAVYFIVSQVILVFFLL